MNWLNINIATLHSPDCMGADPVARATWLFLLAYCAEQENGGRIAGGAAWEDRKWHNTCGVSASEVRAAAPLVTIKGKDVCVAFYPLEKQREVRAKREAGKRGGSAKSVKKTAASRKNGAKGGRMSSVMETQPADSALCDGPVFDPKGNPSTYPTTNPTERNGKEGNKNEKGMYATPPERTPCNLSAPDAGGGEGGVPGCCSPPEAVEYGRRLEPPCPEQWSMKWWEDSERRGWLGPDGLRIVKWKAALSSYWRGVQEMERRVSAQQGVPHINGAGGGEGHGSATPGGPAIGSNGSGIRPGRPGMEKTMSAFEIKTRLGSIEDELARIRLRARDGRSEDGLRTIKLYTDEEKTRREQLLQAKLALQRKLTEA